MKKLFFTAIALVAFSGVSMAKYIDIEEKCELIVNKSTIIAERPSGCCTAYLYHYGVLVDSETKCDIPYSTEGNCDRAAAALIARHPQILPYI